MRFPSCFFILATVLLPSILAAQTAAPVIGGPVAGFVYDAEAGQFRPIRGIPGASTLGDALDVPVPVASAAVSPGQDFALATIGAERSPAILRLNDDPVSVVPIDGALPAPSRIVLSPSGIAAALYYERENKLQLIDGLPSSPSIVNEIETAALAPSAAFAVSDDAAMVLVALSEDGVGSVFLLQPGGFQQWVFSAGEVSALTFLARGDSAMVADRDNNAVYLLRDLSGTPATLALGNAGDGLSAPAAVSVSGDNRQAFVLNSSEGGIVRLDLNGGPSRLFTCSCQPTRLDRLLGTSVYRLTEPLTEPMWLLDGDPSAPRIVFVPPPKAVQTAPLPVEEDGGQL